MKAWKILLPALVLIISLLLPVGCSNHATRSTPSTQPALSTGITTAATPPASSPGSQLVAPAPLSPGSSDMQNPSSLSNLTPTLKWSPVLGADAYQVVIDEYMIDNWTAVFTSQQVTVASLDLPAGVLVGGSLYCWFVAAHAATGWSQFSPAGLYFST